MAWKQNRIIKHCYKSYRLTVLLHRIIVQLIVHAAMAHARNDNVRQMCLAGFNNQHSSVLADLCSRNVKQTNTFYNSFTALIRMSLILRQKLSMN